MPLSTTEATYRILDASLNRAAEGLRTLEEFARFALDDAELAAEAKALRHSLAAAAHRLSRPLLLAARDTPGDVGAEIGVASEYRRQSFRDVVSAASARTQQSLRCLEEYGKTINPDFAVAVERIRYRSYELCRVLEQSASSDRRRMCIEVARLYVLIDAGPSAESFAETVRTLMNAGVDVLQLRDRGQEDRVLFERACVAADLTRSSETLFIVNDRSDLAVAADADGVHVGQEELPVAAARQIVGPERLVGLSTHSLEQAQQAAGLGADYIGYGPVFPGQTKQFEAYVGTGLLEQIEREASLPVFAIGGITIERLPEVITAGGSRVAVTAAISRATDPVEAAKRLKAMLREADDRRGR